MDALGSISLHGLVASAPATVRELRTFISARGHGIGDKVDTGGKPKSKPPCNVAAIDASDLETWMLVEWASYAGVEVRGAGRFWRVGGRVAGLVSDDVTPVQVVADRLLHAMSQPDWVEPEGMHEALNDCRVRHIEQWPSLMDVLMDVRC
ncbi:hypothetical protein CBI38_24670 [Rhodococcus oxybenzonivorans]|uniref:Uncharacterized protein n=1 Tax=Rhodococcus oxybenzonivorans TaxID=1990687 RepID=A0A2S2C074_9NOCA|nr:hypothetical protein [Rhodococcus oxybenzonivorans]AWK74272.1 hypothetical protein CBI38_24670 [Rhodococcus oxybenzonivorans]